MLENEAHKFKLVMFMVRYLIENQFLFSHCNEIDSAFMRFLLFYFEVINIDFLIFFQFDFAPVYSTTDKIRINSYTHVYILINHIKFIVKN